VRYSRPRPAWPFIAGALALAVAVNGLLFVLDLRGGDAGQRSRADFPLLPPAWVIGAVWTVLLSAMAYVQSRVLRRTQEPALQWLVPILFANCLLYPVYTAGFTSELRGLVGNLLTFALSAYVAGRVHSITRLGSALLGLVVAWSGFATFATFRLPD
jgi:tryptophan-rich sensory protein